MGTNDLLGSFAAILDSGAGVFDSMVIFSFRTGTFWRDIYTQNPMIANTMAIRMISIPVTQMFDLELDMAS